MARVPISWNLRKSSQQRAHASPTTHAFKYGVGYLEYAPNNDLLRSAPHLAMKHGQHRDRSCMPPDNTPAGSKHLLKPPGATPIECTYLPRDQAWMPPLHRPGKRMAFTADYLASHGWKYLHAV